MSDFEDHAKSEKKKAKAAAKTVKKEAKYRAIADAQAATGSADDAGDGLTPAERSAAAAERQVVLHHRRFWISVVTALITLVSLVVTFFC